MSLRSPSGFIRPNYDPLKVADAPTAITPSAGNESASIDCTAPADVGGSAITGYYAVVNPGGITATSVTPPIPVTGLTNGTEYTAKVWANNSYGPSPYSAESAGFTPVNDFVEDVFSTYLYTGNGSTQTITNGIDLAGEGGLVWFKSRNNSTFANSPHCLTDSVTGFSNYLISSQTTQQQSWATDGPVPSSTGFSLPPNGTVPYTNYLSGSTYASWTFRKAPKFFDVVTYTGNGVAGREINHDINGEIGFLVVKRLDSANNWTCQHRAYGGNYRIELNNTDAAVNESGYTGATSWNKTTATSTVFTVGSDASVNENGGTYVAYLFAHNAGGFGADGTEDVISCGSYTGDGTSGQLVNLGWEPQFVLVKRADSTGNWMMVDIMRGSQANGAYPCNNLHANTAESEQLYGSFGPDPLGFRISASANTNNNGSPFIYIAIRRPMKTPTAGTEVFAIEQSDGSGSSTSPEFVAGFPVDAALLKATTASNGSFRSRLTGTGYLETNNTNAEASNSFTKWDFQNGWYSDPISTNYYSWMFRRAPGFFDVVAYTGAGAAMTIPHNLGVVPELMIVKARSTVDSWPVYTAATGNTHNLFLNQTDAAAARIYWNNTTPTDSVFYLGDSGPVTNAGGKFIAYLFATLAGVSKVGSYTGTAADLNVDCGFSAGARFILIKRTDSTGDWYLWDSARGIVAGNDPYLLLNSTAAEVTGTDYIDPYSAGFTVTSSAPAALNASGGTYIFLAIA